MNEIVPEVAWRIDCMLGEGPVWLPRESALRFVDIKRGQVHRFDPASGQGETRETGGSPSFVVPAQGGRLIVGSRNSLRWLEDGFGEEIAAIPEPAHNRTNDATVDERGRLWFGTMDDDEQAPTGAIWCYDRGTLTRAGPTAMITNGPAVSGDGWLYHVDTGEQTVFRTRLGDGPTLGESDVFVRLAEGEGYPDGVVIDSEDCLWLALWGGWGVRRYSPAGELLLTVKFPCSRVTKIAFGGPDLRTVYATTARKDMSEEELQAQPLAGSLFTFRAPVAGRALPEVRL